MNLDNQHIILFDGECNLCNGVVQFIIHRDQKRKFKFASLQSESGQALSRIYGLPTAKFDTFVYLKSGRFLLRSDAALHLAKGLGYPWKLLVGFVIIPKFIRDAVYGFISKNRYRFFGKAQSCMLPKQGMQGLFLP